MPLRALTPLLALVLAACSSPEEVREQTGLAAHTPAASASAAATASSSVQGVKVAEETDLFSYAFSYPAEVTAQPRLAALLTERAERVKAGMIADAKEAQGFAKAEGYPFHPHSYGAKWQRVADLPGHLSLSNDFHTYTGGAHGMYGLEGLVWDKAAQRALPSEELFVSPGALGTAMGDTVCIALNQEREKRRGAPVDPRDELFSDCPALDEATILVGSSNGKTFDRITVWFGPYVAGAYAEGAYDLDFPVTQAMLAAVKPAYRDAFDAKR